MTQALTPREVAEKIVAEHQRDPVMASSPHRGFSNLVSDIEAALTSASDRGAEAMREALESAIRVAGEAADEWDAAPQGMKAGKLLIALSGRLMGYRPDIDAIHAALSNSGVQRLAAYAAIPSTRG